MYKPFARYCEHIVWFLRLTLILGPPYLPERLDTCKWNWSAATSLGNRRAHFVSKTGAYRLLVLASDLTIERIYFMLFLLFLLRSSFTIRRRRAAILFALPSLIFCFRSRMRVLFCKILSPVSRVLRRGQNASLHDFMTFSFLLLDFFPTVFFDSDILSAQWLFIWRHDLIDFLDGIFASRALSSSFIIASLPWTDWIRDSIDSLEIFTGFSPTADGPMPSDHWRFPQLVHRQTGKRRKPCPHDSI